MNIMDVGQFVESCESIGEAFFYQRVREALTDNLPQEWSKRRVEYVQRMTNFLDNAIKGYNLNRMEMLPVGKCFTKDGESVLGIYLKVINAIPVEIKKEINNNKKLLGTMKGFKKTLKKIKSGADVPSDEKNFLLELVDNLQEEIDSRNSRNFYNNTFSCLA
jgi:hypothetical protein